MGSRVSPRNKRLFESSIAPPLDELQYLAEAMIEARAELGSGGRILVRYSGTEPLLRILVEAKKEVDASFWIDRIEQSAMREASLGITASF